jgi:thioredoxin-like negative regulator of GroEL
MEATMIERLLIVLLLALVSIVAFQGFRFVHVRRMTRSADKNGRSIPTLLYFHSDNCAACPMQERALDQLATAWNGRLAIERIDAGREPEKASRYRVFSLPTTILIDTAGQIRQINYGLANSSKLERQLAML